MPQLSLTVYGEPAPQGSKQAYVRGGKAVLVESSKKVGPWRKAVKEAALLLVGSDFEPLSGPLEIETVFYVSRPASVKRALPTVPPDLDKLERGLWDAVVQAGLVVDDSLFVRSLSTKLYADLRPPGAEVVITSVDYIPLAIENAA